MSHGGYEIKSYGNHIDHKVMFKKIKKTPSAINKRQEYDG
jgi:hypothetical protein